MAALEKLKTERAFVAGVIAHKAGYPRLAPLDLGKFERCWLDGWEQASTSTGAGRPHRPGRMNGN